ncbi:hypothetical protein NMY22_g17625 [Coprinellus aureogranulatus]|nr:hypothetical protein NMY22_g17625 [Coprinellus aureogranulatus]
MATAGPSRRGPRNGPSGEDNRDNQAAIAVFPNAQKQAIDRLGAQVANRDIRKFKNCKITVHNHAQRTQVEESDDGGLEYASETTQQQSNILLRSEIVSGTTQRSGGALEYVSETIQQPSGALELASGTTPNPDISTTTSTNVHPAMSGAVTFRNDISVRSMDAIIDNSSSFGATIPEVYVRKLFNSGHGLPCWQPEPRGFDPEKRGALPGDVGTYTVKKGFEKLFNLWECQDAIQTLASVYSSGSHQPLLGQITRELLLQKGEVVCNGCLTESPVVSSSPAEEAVVHEFVCHSDSGAILALTSPAVQFETNDVKALRTYVDQHAEAIFRHANTVRQIDPWEPLCVISGCVKADSWAIAAYQERMQSPYNLLRLVRKPASMKEHHLPGTSYQWTKQGSSTARLSRPAEPGWRNQNLFLEGFEVALPGRLWSRITKTSSDADPEASDAADWIVVSEDMSPPPGHAAEGVSKDKHVSTTKVKIQRRKTSKTVNFRRVGFGKQGGRPGQHKAPNRVPRAGGDCNAQQTVTGEAGGQQGRRSTMTGSEGDGANDPAGLLERPSPARRTSCTVQEETHAFIQEETHVSIEGGTPTLHQPSLGPSLGHSTEAITNVVSSGSSDALRKTPTSYSVNSVNNVVYKATYTQVHNFEYSQGRKTVYECKLSLRPHGIMSLSTDSRVTQTSIRMCPMVQLITQLNDVTPQGATRRQEKQFRPRSWISYGMGMNFNHRGSSYGLVGRQAAERQPSRGRLQRYAKVRASWLGAFSSHQWNSWQDLKASP